MNEPGSSVGRGLFSLERSQERHDLVGNISLRVDTSDYGSLRFDGLTFNVSKSGACVFLSRNLEKGLELSLTGKVFGTREICATVMWCEKIEETLFKVGLSFSD